MPSADAPSAKGPTYSMKVNKAISALKSRNGSSVPALTSWITENYGAVNKVALSAALKKGVADESLAKVKASYKLGPKAVKASKPKKTIAKKPAKKAAPAKKKAAPKKKAAEKKSTTKKAATKKKTATKKAAPKKKAASKKSAAKK